MVRMRSVSNWRYSKLSKEVASSELTLTSCATFTPARDRLCTTPRSLRLCGSPMSRHGVTETPPSETPALLRAISSAQIWERITSKSHSEDGTITSPSTLQTGVSIHPHGSWIPVYQV